MADTTAVILVTGFLGSGKTTFMNHLLKAVPAHCKTLVLVNEFGEVGLDGALVRGDGYDVLEVSKGSIFCICVKRDFIKALHQVASDIRPDLLLMEATGVANPADLKADLQLPLFHNRFRLVEQICVVDVSSFDQEYKVFASVEKQIATSSIFLLNKVDKVSRRSIDVVKEIIRGHHASPLFIETSHCQMSVDDLLHRCGLPTAARAAEPAPTLKPLSPEELDRIVSALGNNPFRAVTPPDWLMSAAYQWSGGGDELRKLVRELPKGVVRGKGLLDLGDGLRMLNIVMDEATFEPVAIDAPPELRNRIVLIFPPELEDELAALVGRWSPRLAPLAPAAGGCG